MTDLCDVFDNVRRGMIPAHIYNDAELFALEKERLFSRAWTFVGHESEIPQDGDYVVRRVLDDSFIISRDSDGRRAGHVQHVPAPRDAGVSRGDGQRLQLPLPVPRLVLPQRRPAHRAAVSPRGLRRRRRFPPERPNPACPHRISRATTVCCSSAWTRPPNRCEDFLGDFRFYLDFYTKQSAGGLELRGPQRWRIKANWKIGAENFAGDMYHTPHTHASIVDIGLFREPKAQKRKDGATYWAHRGGGTTYKLPPGDFDERMRYVGYPDEMIGRIKDAWTPRQQRVVGEDGFMISAATCFPNLSFVHNWPKLPGSDQVLPFISIRLWQPISENETEVCSWFAVDSAAPAQYKQDSYKAYLMCFGSTGMFEQDDVENWVSLTTTAGGSMARRLLLNSRMGLLSDDRPVVEALPAESFHGPGRAQVGYNEYNQRALLKLWADYLQQPWALA